MAKNDNLKDFLTDVADAIREKKGTTDLINPQDFSSEIASIQSGGDIWGFDTIGYTPQSIPMKEWVEHSKLKMEQFTPSNALTIFENDSSLHFAPLVDLSGITSMKAMFCNCYSLVVVPLYNTSNILNMRQCFYYCSALTDIPLYDTTNVTDMSHLFNGCESLKSIPKLNMGNVTTLDTAFANTGLIIIPSLNTQKCENFNYLCANDTDLAIVEGIDMESATKMTTPFSNCKKLLFIKVTNLGKSTLTTYDFSGASVWGTNGEENKQSLIDSLITYSYDRASNGMSTATIKLSANTKALLTEEEIAQITNKGFTIS